MKTMGGYVPATDQDAEICLRHKLGDIIRADFKKMRNPNFHRKFFSLLNIGYEAWEPEPINNKFGTAEKNFDRFRSDCIILAGYYTQSIRVDGSVCVEAQSISFGNMEEEDFNKLYSAVINVLLSKVLRTYNGREELESIVDKVLGFC